MQRGREGDRERESLEGLITRYTGADAEGTHPPTLIPTPTHPPTHRHRMLEIET